MGNHEPDSSPRVGWFKSSRSNNGGGCVEVKFDGDSVLIRDSKYLRNPINDPASQPIITVPAIKWKGFLENVVGKAADDVVGAPAIERDPAGGATLRALDGTVLVYDEVEWDAFVCGILDEEFALTPA